ncbi:pantoate--beta-alanine ligase [Leifsonia sp. 71-9]|uniref:pantoate--beta-alanine ligase n=1 Tax=Leifsonia sp. 71-9 TaxID=1895934 RepID=UPI000929102A|nr:pantoate--beta-alanine ligase [Leifsonia sp. 71-9]OJX73222.1 MAG: pantoate--beta-alanine ligase [Leifsonia sp. 71-9]
MPHVVTTIAELRALIASARREALLADPAGDPAGLVALVPTMGALHDGHLRLVRQARELAGVVVVSIFVNPLQFGPGEDLDRYPRTLDADVAALEGVADIVFAPSAAEMYPQGESSTRVTAGEVGSLFEGASRPGHFDGMLTVVAKLFGIVQPDVAVFGQKDAQQVHLVGRMIDDLNLPLTLAVVDTVREDDGLALSSRNQYLSSDDRVAAVTLSQALAAGAEAAQGGVEAALAAARTRIEDDPAVKLDYLVIVDQPSFREAAPGHHGPALMLVAARVGTTRLIDNRRITIP